MDMQHLLKQAQRLQKELAEQDERLKAHRSEGSAGGGAAQVVVNGEGEVLDLKLDDELVASGDAALIAETLLAALRQAHEAGRAYRDEQRATLAGGLKLPDL